MRYFLQDAVRIAKALEAPIFEKFKLHIAIGGSCVYRGHSDKDVDIFLYPHDKRVEIDRLKVAEWLEGHDFIARNMGGDDHTQVPDVLVTENPVTGVRVDWFFLKRHVLLLKKDEKTTPRDLIQNPPGNDWDAMWEEPPTNE